MKLKPLQLPKIALRRLLPWLPLASFVAMFILLLGLIYFLYRNFYQTIAQIKVVYILRTQVALNQVDVLLYKNVTAAWENKKKIDPIVEQITHDPFAVLPEEKTQDLNAGLNQANQIVP